MIGFLAETGSKLADRRAALLVLPACSMPRRSPPRPCWASSRSQLCLAEPKGNCLGNSPALRPAGGTVLTLGAILAGSVIAGLVATAGGRFVGILWTLPGGMFRPGGWLSGGGKLSG